MKLKDNYKYALAGALAGTVNGFFGMGGGMLLVPMFCRLCKMEERRAFATSVSVILPLSAVSSVIYLLRDDYSVLSALPFLLGGMLGGFFSGKIFKKVPTGFLRVALALFIIYGGIRSIMS